jgi:hypothetical protein
LPCGTGKLPVPPFFGTQPTSEFGLNWIGRIRHHRTAKLVLVLVVEFLAKVPSVSFFPSFPPIVAYYFFWLNLP